MVLTYDVIDNNFINIKELLKAHFLMSDKLIAKLKSEKKIFLNGYPVYVTHALNISDTVEIYLDFEESSETIVPIKMNLNILYEDDAYIVIDKQAGHPVHPSHSHFDNSISNGLKYYFNEKNINKKIRPVNRLDMDTSGIVIFAKNEYVQESLIKQMKTKIFKKEYLAVLEGHLENKKGTINKPISRKEGSIIERQVSDDGAESITHFEVVESFKTASLVSFILETGRTHQIRVHSSSIGHPIIGDSLYGNTSDLISRQALHACKVEFIHPITRKKVSYSSNLPKDIQNLIEILYKAE